MKQKKNPFRRIDFEKLWSVNHSHDWTFYFFLLLPVNSTEKISCVTLMIYNYVWFDKFQIPLTLVDCVYANNHKIVTLKPQNILFANKYFDKWPTRLNWVTIRSVIRNTMDDFSSTSILVCEHINTHVLAEMAVGDISIVLLRVN